MKVLWLCNFMLPAVAQQLQQKATNKEGWISGMAQVILKHQQENQIALGVAFPVPEQLDGYKEVLPVYGGNLTCYGFYEDTLHPEQYDAGLEEKMRRITEDFQPDVVHCYGTEYPHTLAMCRVYPDKSKLLISIQGLCSVYANTYYADLPEKVIRHVTFRDWLKRDSMVLQKEKYVKRGEMEIEAVKLAGNVAGRTQWDLFYTRLWHPEAKYHHLNETLRECFYEGQWTREKAVPHTIFLSQGNYPIKGFHYMLLALGHIRRKYEDVKVFVAGDSIIRYDTWKDKLKISAYGNYLRSLIRRFGLEDCVTFLGSLTGEQMKEQYLKSDLFVCCSTIENSPNSLGEAMILGVPCVSADCGGVKSIFTEGEDGILYPGFRTPDNAFDLPYCGGQMAHAEELCRLERNAKALAEAVLEMWSHEERRDVYCANARIHALKTHNREENYRRMLEIYGDIKNT